MKKYLFLVSALIFLSCSSDEEIIDLNAQKDFKEKPINLNKVDICHLDQETGEYKTINVSRNAIDAHLAHGDAVGNCDDIVTICKDDATLRVNKFDLEDYEPFELGSCESGQVPGMEYTYVPDDNFEQALIDLKYDDELDNLVLTANISSISSLDIQFRNIGELRGIDDFISLETLIVSGNNLNSIDISHNLMLKEFRCDRNDLESLDTSNNIHLTKLVCYGNLLVSLDFSNNGALVFLQCWRNKLISLNLRNVTLTNFNALNNRSLNCVQVDDTDYYELKFTNRIPDTASFLEDCSY